MGGLPCRGRRSAIVFTGGDPPYPQVRRMLPEPAVVIGADSGLDHALALGIAVDHVIGDLDSVSAEGLAKAEAAGTRVHRHPAAKDATDLELALDLAREVADHIVVVGGDGGRLDHLLGTAVLLGSDRYADRDIAGFLGPAAVRVIRSRTALTGRPGELLTLLALGGPADGVVTAGLRYPLRGESLLPGSSRGVSNEFITENAEVSLAAGVLLAIAPESIAPHSIPEES